MSRLEAPGGRQQRCGGVIASAGRQDELGSQELAGGSLTLFDRTAAGDRVQAACGLERARLDVGERGVQSTATALRKVGCQLHRAGQERGRGGSPPRACARPAERSNSAATLRRAHGGAGQVPGSPVGVSLSIGRCGQGTVHTVPAVGGGLVVGG